MISQERIPAPTANPHRLSLRTLILFTNFLLIMVAYYQVKAASRSLLLEYGGPAAFPYVWIGSALVLLVFISIYQRLVNLVSRNLVVIGTLITVAVILVLFRYAFGLAPKFPLMASFYIFVDIFSVILVEQFWSMTNAVSYMEEGKKTYWLVGTGGLLGSILGGFSASTLLQFTSMHTQDLLLSCAALLSLCAVINMATWRFGLYEEVPPSETISLTGEGFMTLIHNRFLLLIAALICLSQLVQPIVEYQFLNVINEHFTVMDIRTAFISNFFIVLGLVSIAVNFLVTPVVHRHLGVIAGLFAQPFMLAITSVIFAFNYTLNMGAIMKISDRGLSYSINRASKELLYVPLDAVHIYQVKAWIDMLGYRMFKVAGAGLILLVTSWFAVTDVKNLGWYTLLICAVWIVVILRLANAYRNLPRSGTDYINERHPLN
jgi:AAA family ATP:ADP antiporter